MSSEASFQRDLACRQGVTAGEGCGKAADACLKPGKKWRKPLTRAMSASTSGACTRMHSGEDASAASRKCTPSKRAPKLMTSMCVGQHICCATRDDLWIANTPFTC